MKAKQVVEKWLQTSEQTGAGQVDQVAGQAPIPFPKGTPNIPEAVLHCETPSSPVLPGARTPVSPPRASVDHNNTPMPSNPAPSNRVNNNISAPGPLSNLHHNPATTPSITHQANQPIYPPGLNPQARNFVSKLSSPPPIFHQQARKYSSPGSFALLLTSLSRGQSLQSI